MRTLIPVLLATAALPGPAQAPARPVMAKICANCHTTAPGNLRGNFDNLIVKNGAFQVKIDETGGTYPAKVIRLGAKVDPVSQSVKTIAVIDGQFPELIAGMSGRVVLTPPTTAPAPQK